VGVRRLTRYYAAAVLSLAVLFVVGTPGWTATGQTDQSGSKACGEPQTTLLTPDSDALATSLGNPNNGITIVFRTRGTAYWTTLLSSSNVNVALSNNRGNAIVTFQKGLTVYMTANGAAGFNLFLSGTIVDDGTSYAITGLFLGNFTC
jgi:hypothetical protein